MYFIGKLLAIIKHEISIGFNELKYICKTQTFTHMYLNKEVLNEYVSEKSKNTGNLASY